MSYIDDDVLRVYVASAHTNHERANLMSGELLGLGCEVVSEWTTRPIGWTGSENDNQDRAEKDIEELRKANVYVGLITADSLTSHAEFGFALASGYPCFVCIDDHYGMLNMLMFHPDVMLCDDADDIIRRIKMLVKAKVVACDVCGADMKRVGDLLRCRCGASRERSPLAWKDELIRGHRAFCAGTPIDKGETVHCKGCGCEWSRDSSGLFHVEVVLPESGEKVNDSNSSSASEEIPW